MAKSKAILLTEGVRIRRLLLSIHIFNNKSLGLGPGPARIKAPNFAVSAEQTSLEFFCYSWQTVEGSEPKVEQGSFLEIGPLQLLKELQFDDEKH